MKKKIYSLMLIFSMIAVFIPAEPAAAQDIRVGEYIKFGRYLGEPILWRCVAADENGPLILSDKIIAIRPFDSKGEKTKGSHGRGYGFNRMQYGSNYWGDSNIRSWLNSSAQAGYVDWECGNPPIPAKYAEEAGFLANFTSTEKKSIKSVQQKSLLDGYEHNPDKINSSAHIYKNSIDNVLQNYDNAYSEEVNDLIFLLDIKQIYTVYNNFKNDNYYIGTLTEKAAAALNPAVPTPDSSGAPVTTPKITYKEGDPYGSFLRSPRAAANATASLQSIQVRYVTKDGKINSTQALSSDGIRPAFYLDTALATFASGSGTEDDPYVIAMGEDDSPINQPIRTPSPSPDAPTQEPTNVPTGNPTSAPSDNPTGNPTSVPSDNPTGNPTSAPSDTPTQKPIASNSPTPVPLGSKSVSPIGKYADKVNINMKAENNQVLFTLTSSEIPDLSNISLFIASYDSDGNLNSVSIGDNLLFGDELMILADIYSTGTYKLILMDNELDPLMKSETVHAVITITQ